MSETSPDLHHSFALQKTTDPSRQPLEVYHLSHDLRGPLNSILGFAELLLEEIEGPLSEMQRADIAAIYQSAQHLLHLINTVVDLSKLEADRLIFDFGPVDLAELIDKIVASGFGAAKPEHLEIVAQLTQEVPPIRGDRDRVEQMLRSLLRFGFKAKKKGQITLAAHGDAEKVTLEVELGQMELPQVELAELFELLVKVDPTGRSKLGRGELDLPLARYLAEKQQGRIWAEHKNGTNLTFFINLPVYTAGVQG